MAYDFRETPLNTDSSITWSYTATFEDDAGSPLVFTGWDFEMEGRRAHGAANPPYFEISVGAGITLGSGTVTMTIADSVLAAIPPGKYVWELRGENGSGDGEITIKGPWYHHAGVVT